jgi:hypothetical protein
MDPMSVTAAQFADWMPIRIYWQGNQPTVDWCHLGSSRFTDPFFTGTIEKALRQPFNLLFRRQTPIESLCELQTCEPGLPPTGFIFHMSRCGSTLMAQMLAALPQNIVISEAGPIDAILNAGFRDPAVTDEQRMLWLRALLSAFGRRRHQQEEHFFIKFDSWHALDLALIHQAFPAVPWIFLYRDPVEVLISHQNMPGAQMIPGSLGARIGYSVADVVGRMSMAEYGARVLARICNAALEHRNDHGLFVDYRQMPEAVWLLLETHFGVVPSEAEIVRMRNAAEFDAKTPCMPFIRDEAKKKRQATEMISAVSAKWLDPVYERLEALRWRSGLETILPVETGVDLAAVRG